MPKKGALSLSAPAQLSGNELADLARAHAQAHLATEQEAHARTKLEMVRLAAQHAALLASYRGKESIDEAQAALREAEAASQNASTASAQLGRTLRESYSLTDEHVICPLTGAITQLGA